MKFLSYVILLPTLLTGAMAQSEYQAKAALSPEKGGTFLGYLTATTKTKIRFKRSPTTEQFKDEDIKSFSVIFPLKPDEYSEGMDLYESGKYEEARAIFAAYKEKSAPVSHVEGNYHTLSAFQEMESFRMEGDYVGLAKALESFKKAPLTTADDERQLNLYVMWDAVRAEDWEKLLGLAQSRSKTELPGYQQVQVSYCLGLALDKLDRKSEALIHYARAITADAGASAPIASKAAFNTLQIYAIDPLIIEAIAIWGTAEEQKGSFGYLRLRQAISLAKIYKTILGGAVPLEGVAAKFAELKLPESA